MGFLWSWIPNFALLARPLHRAAKQTPRGPRTDPSPVKHLFSKREDCLTLGPVSALQDPPKPPYLLTDERSRSAPRLLVQPTGPTERTRADLSQQLDVAAQGWQPCLRALAGAASLTKEALRLTLQGPSPFSPLTAWDTDLLSQKSVSHLDPSRLQLDLLLFIENPDIYLPTSRLNPAPLLRVGTPPRDSLRTLPFLPSTPAGADSSTSGLSYQALPKPDRILFVDGSSLIAPDGQRETRGLRRTCLPTLDAVLEAAALPLGTPHTLPPNTPPSSHIHVLSSGNSEGVLPPRVPPIINGHLISQLLETLSPDPHTPQPH